MGQFLPLLSHYVCEFLLLQAIHSRSGEDNDIQTGLCGCLVPEEFPQQAFNAISVDGQTNVLLCDNQTQAMRVEIVAPGQQE